MNESMEEQSAEARRFERELKNLEELMKRARVSLLDEMIERFECLDPEIFHMPTWEIIHYLKTIKEREERRDD